RRAARRVPARIADGTPSFARERLTSEANKRIAAAPAAGVVVRDALRRQNLFYGMAGRHLFLKTIAHHNHRMMGGLRADRLCRARRASPEQWRRRGAERWAASWARA